VATRPLQVRCQDPNQLGLVLGPHLRGDHFGGLPFLILDGQFAHRTRPLHVAGPAGVGVGVEAAMEVLVAGSTRGGAGSRSTSRSSPTGSRCALRSSPPSWW
jgi:ribonuclease BN (tRNA processing enzyme)